MPPEQKTAKVQIFKAPVEDCNRAYAIVDEYCQEINATIRDTESEFIKYFSEDSAVWLAEVEGEIIGCIALRPLPQKKNSCEVKRLYVRQNHRGQGIADKLLESLHAYATAKTYSWCYLDTKDDLQTAVKFYLRNGYEHCSRYNDNPQATVFMRKKLLARH